MDPVVQKLDCAIHQINIYPLESGTGFHPLVSDLADGQRYPSSEQPGPAWSSLRKWPFPLAPLLVSIVQVRRYPDRPNPKPAD